MPSFSETLFSCLGIKAAEERVAQNPSKKQFDTYTLLIEHSLNYTLKMSAANGTSHVGTSAGGRLILPIAHDLTNNVLRPSPD
jgi:hypothetical protein